MLKSLFDLIVGIGLLDEVVWILKMEKWSDMSVGIMPEKSCSVDGILVRMLSMRVAECGVILVGLVIKGEMA